MNKEESRQENITNWGVVPFLPEFFHLREALLDQGSEKLHCLSSVEWNFRDNLCDYTGFFIRTIKMNRNGRRVYILSGLGTIAIIWADFIRFTEVSETSL